MKTAIKIVGFVAAGLAIFLAGQIVAMWGLPPQPAHKTDTCELTQHYVWGEYKYHADIVTVHTDDCINLCERLATMLSLTTKMDGAYFTCRLVSEIPQEVQKQLDKENQL